VLVTAGPTHEPIDRVRYLANRSSGRMGMAIASAAVKRGWPVTLLLGPVSAGPPEHSLLQVERFQTAADLGRLLQARWPSHDLLIMAAAVADYTAAEFTDGKLRRRTDDLHLRLRPTPDLLASLSTDTRFDQTTIGFALEHEANLTSAAREKLASKRLDAIVANPLETIDAPVVTATLLWRNGQVQSPPAAMTKAAFADWLLEQVEPVVRARIQPRRGV
jgi:phosphopantothenoylcysteine decarboxylase/phosphopantothenate--cysteine ligase